MDWLTGGGRDGWEDDEDDLEDLSDQSLEQEEEEEEGNERPTDASQFHHEPPAQQQQPQGGVELGGGMFMGRLTRFLEAVTQPGSDEDEDGEGWDDDDGLGDLDNDDETDMDQPEMAMQTPAAVVPTTSTRLMATSPEPAVAAAAATQSELVDSGWEDDLDLSFEPQPDLSHTTTTDVQFLPLNDATDEPSPPDNDDEMVRNVAFGELPTVSNDGWGDGEDGLEDVVVEEDLVAEETMPPLAPSRQISSLSSAAKTEGAVANSTSSGWDEEEQELAGLEGDGEDEDDTAAPSQWVDHTPPPPAPAFQSRANTSSTLQTQSVSFGGASAVALAPPSLVEDGWDDEENEDSLLNDDEDASKPTQILDHTPSIPTQRPATDTTSHAVSFAAQSTETVAASNDSGWEEDVDVLDDLDVEDGAQGEVAEAESPSQQILDHTPPPPPPPTTNDGASHAVSFAAHSTEGVAPSTDSGWDDDGTLDDLGVGDEETRADEQNKMVDLTPPPPLPPRGSQAMASASAVAVGTITEDHGWDDDDDDLDNLEDDEHVQEENATPLVDHTPPPPPPKSNAAGRDTTTEGAVRDMDGDDDISRDDTLSIANSRARHEEHRLQLSQQSQGPPWVDRIPVSLNEPIRFKRIETTDAVKSNNSVGSSTLDDFRPAGDAGSGSIEEMPSQGNIVDHTPSASRLDRHASSEEAMVALGGGGGGGNSSVSDSWDSFSDRVSDVRTRSRRMVDLTPPVARFHRGMPIDTSLAVEGQTSVGESLDSIDEEEEELESPQSQAHTSTPSAAEAGWGGSHRRIGEEYTINIEERISAAIPFGSPITPTASSSSAGGGIPHTTLEDNEDGDDGMPLVDHTPIPPVKNHSTPASVDVLSVSSEEGDLGESIVGMDDVKEDLYGQVVDHTPATPNPAERPKVESGLPGGAVTKQEDDTVVGVAENTEVEKDINADDEMDDESSRGTKTTLEEYENRSLVSTVRLTIPEEKQLVDHVPLARKMSSTMDASTVVFADASSGSSRVEDNIVNDDDTYPAGFGPIVDHTPSVHFRSARSVATSVVTQNSGLEVDLKEDDDLDNTVGPASMEGGEEGWEAEQSSLPPSISEEKHVVDHVPKRSGRQYPIDGSMRVMVDNADDMTQVDTIAEDAAADFGPIVDHTPFTARSVGQSVEASMVTLPVKPEDELDCTTAVGGVSTEGGDGWDNDIPDLEDISAGEEAVMDEHEEPTLVDNVPRQPFPRPGDASTLAVGDPMDAASTIGYDDTTANNGDERYGPVVDHTPTPPMSGTHVSVDESMRVHVSELEDGNRNKDDGDEDDMEDGGTWFGASTVGGVSTVGASGEASSGGDSSRGGWEQDGDTLDDLASPSTPACRIKCDDSHVVDHVPQISTPGPADASIAVMMDPSVASLHQKEEIEDNIDVGSFGAVVDQTPSVTKTSQNSVANSMATNATGIAADIRRDEEMDETTWNGGASTHEEGWDQDEPDLEDLVDTDEDQMPPLVDHVPERPESRPTDASTFVAGDPSEIFSQVDDLGQDETHFGPVVDQTPHAQFNVYASAAGSTVVNIASVAEDDLDVAVEKAIDGEDPTREAEEQTGWQETLPNPQSGNDEDSQDREQLVDYVPDEQQEEIPDIVRDGSSEMATVGEKSTMIPADDPKEDEFGPVVDQLPIREGLNPPGSSPVTASNGRDRIKAATVSSSGAQNIDSIAPNFSVESKESKDDGLEEDEFGPVVDHLPNASSRASFTPSRGGSTVDALATVSEVDDDYVPGDGWEDDVDIDTGDQPSPSASARPGEDRNLSVKWVDGVNGKDNAGQSAGTSESAYFDAEMGDSSRTPLNETRYYDPELGDTNAWGSLTLEDPEDGDDTPPSTPRSSFQSRGLVEAPIDDSKPAAVTILNGNGGCRLCASSSSADCPCVKRLLAANNGKEGMVGTLKTPEGNFLKVNFDKLLETEMTKRRLVEKEFQALRATIESLKSSKDSLVLAGETQMEVLNNMKDANCTLSTDLEAARAETDGQRAQKEDFQSKNKTLEGQLTVLQEDKRKLETECLTLKRDMEVLQARITQVSSSATSNLSARENELQSEISKWKGSTKELSHKIARFETECENLRGKNESLYEDLEAYRESMAKLEEEKAAMLSKESSLNVEIKHLKGTLQNQRVATTTGSFQAQIAALQSEIASKSGECAELKSQIASLQKKLSVSEAEKDKQTEELARVTEDRKQTIAEFETRISRTKEEMLDALRSKDASMEELNRKLASEGQLIRQLKEEKATLENLKKTDAMAHQGAIAEKNRQILAVDNARKTTAAKFDALEKEKQRLSAEISSLSQRATTAEAKTKDLVSVRKERDHFEDALEQTNVTIAQMQAKITQSDQKMEERVSNWQREITTLNQERDRLASQLSSSGQNLEDLTRDLAGTESEKQELQSIIAELQTRCAALEGASQEAQANEQGSVAKLKAQLNQLEDQLSVVSDRNDELLAQNSRQVERYSELQGRFDQVLADLENAKSERSNLLSRLAESEGLARDLRSEMGGVKSDRQELQLKYQELVSNSSVIEDAEKHRSAAMANQKELQDLAVECDVIRRELSAVRASYDDRGTEIKNLQNELSMSKGLLADRDQSIVILKEQQKSSRAGYAGVQKSNEALAAKAAELEAKIQLFDQERAKLKRESEEHTRITEEIHKELAAVKQQRDTFEQERNMLEEENEEMLVQFGLLKEEMDTTDEQLEQLHKDRAEWERSAREAQSRLEEAQKKIDELTTILKEEADEALVAMEAAKDQLAQEKHELEISSRELSEQNHILQCKLREVESEKISLLEQIDDLGRQVSETVANSKAKESRLQSIISGLENKNEDLSRTSHVQENQISELRSSFDRSQSAAKDAADLRQRLKSLEQSLADNERLLQQKDGTVEDLRFQLDNAGRAPVESAELETLRRTVREMEDSAERDRSNIQELESLSGETTRELQKTIEQLSSTELLVEQLRNGLRGKQRKEQEMAELQERLQATEAKLAQANHDASSFRAESTDLRGRLAELESELEDYRRSSQQTTKEPSGQSSAEMQSLRHQIEQLKKQQIASSSQSGAREEVIEREVLLLQQQMRQKDGEISKLERELHSLGSDLSHKHKELQNKQQHVDKLSSELEDLRSQTNQSATSRALELTRDEAENAEKMRSQIISLAKALERSEGRRAVAIERLESERQANADSLRRLTESVKRFYSTLSLRDN